ncbi:diphosphomevalonate decarboxylase-like [Limulus polyphemus]|uniref:Diphosphomevalonate decarboxylase n=1 Tax=Limulus polyphemus TaxID=6850 RepID=A0ABM1BCY2_LIMPO|nr:diphosphomevalonate decarboxylase-like [Limulus polyphemus]
MAIMFGETGMRTRTSSYQALKNGSSPNPPLLCAETTVAISRSFSQDKMWLNGKEQSMDNPRIQNCLREIRRRVRKRKTLEENSTEQEDLLNCHIHICSKNNFPTAAGLASSAAGYACLVFTLGKLFGVDGDLSEIARQGSGSACRSMYGGFVQWCTGDEENGTDSVAQQVASEKHWPSLRILILVVSNQKKGTSSSQGMQQSVRTSELLKFRSEKVIPRQVNDITQAIKEKDFSKFAEITMKDSNQLHAICQDTFPPIKYMNDTSWGIVELVHKYNSFCGETKVAYTFDAGPNACLYLLEPCVPEVISLIRYCFPSSSDGKHFITGLPVQSVALSQELIQGLQFTPCPDGLQYIIHTQVGSGPELVDEQMLDANGLPKTKCT